MSAPTMPELLAKVREAQGKIAANQARAFLKAENIRSFSKLDEVLATGALKGLTKEELEAKYGAPTEDDFPAVNGNGRKTGGTKKAAAKKAVAKKGASQRRTATVVEAGPRGFRFGERWSQSVIDGTAPATAAANINKLKAHAKELGVDYERGDDAATICKKMAPKVRRELAKAA